MNILLTGGTGFVGINIAEKLLDDGNHVIIYDTNQLIHEAELSFQKRSGKFTFVQGDILNFDLLKKITKNYSIDTIIHTAVITPNQRREIDEFQTIIDVNCIGTIQVLKIANKFNIDKVIYLSSAAVYGQTIFENNEVNEELSVLKPFSLYEISKFTSEKIAMRYKQLLNMNIISVRIGDVFGPWEYYTGLRDTMSGVFQATRLAFLRKKALIPYAGRKNWVYSKDVSNSILALIKNNSLKHDIYNITSNYNWTLYEWCQLLSKKYEDFDFEITNSLQRRNVSLFGKPMKDEAQMNINRLINDTGYKPQYNLYRAFEDYMTWIDRTTNFWTINK